MFPKAACVPALRLGLVSLTAALGIWLLPFRWTPALAAYTVLGLALAAALCLWRRQALTAYLCGVLAIGVYLAASWQQHLPVRTESLVPSFPAVVEGHIVDILRVPPPVFRCIVKARVDAQPLPPFEGRLLLNIAGATGSEPWAVLGAGIRAIVRLRPPRTALLPTDFPERDYCAHLGVQWVATTPASAVSQWETEAGLWEKLWRILIQQRMCLRRWIHELYPPTTRAVALALLTGDVSELAPEQRREFALTGISHVLAISGLHIGVVAGAALLGAGFLRWRWLQWMLFSLATALFVALTGAQPSALRAGMMASAGFGLYILQRVPHPVNVVAAVAVGMLLAEPGFAFSRSFQLSVLATGGITVLYTPFVALLRRLFPRLPQWGAQSTALTLAATCTSAPVVALGFGVFSLLALPLNLIAVPLSSAALIAGLLGLGIYPFVPHLGLLYSSAAHACLKLLQEATSFAAALPISAIEERTGAVVAACGTSVMLLWLLNARHRRHALARTVVVGIGMLLGYSLLSAAPAAQVIPREHLVAAFLPQGRGSMLVVLADRMPRRKPRSDAALERYLAALPGELHIAYTGYSSELLAIRCYRLRPHPTRMFPMPTALAEYLQSSLRCPLARVIRPMRFR